MAPSPAPYPATGGDPALWTCNDRTSPAPTTYPSPVADLAPATPMPTTTPVKVGEDCAVSTWNARPAVPVTVPTPTVAVTVAASSCTTDTPCTVQGTDAQWGYVAFGIGLLVFLVAAVMVAGWRS